MTRTHRVETSLVFKIKSLYVKNPPVVILLRLAAKTAKTFISKMRNDGATKIVERTEAVLEAVEESVSDSFNLLDNLNVFKC